jgi:hypothetical protein
MSWDMKYFDNENQLKDLKLTEDEINAVHHFSDLTAKEKNDLAEFIFNLSLVFYKSFKNEQS